DAVRAARGRELERPGPRADEQRGRAQERGRRDQSQAAGIDGRDRRSGGDELLRPGGVVGTADQKYGAGRVQAGEKFTPGRIRPVLFGMRSADPDDDPGTAEITELFSPRQRGSQPAMANRVR